MVKRKRDEGVTVKLRKRTEIKRKKTLKSSWKIYTKRLPDGFISKFKRKNSNPNDCVINALEMLGFLDTVGASMARLAWGGKPIPEENIKIYLKILLYPLKKTEFKVTGNNGRGISLERFEEEHSKIRKNHAAIGFVIGKDENGNGTGHFFIVAKDKEGKTYIIDPQIFNKRENFMGQCPNGECTEYYKHISGKGLNTFGFIKYHHE